MPVGTGSRLLVYTDGVTEVIGDDDGGAQPILGVIERQSAGGLELLDAILAEVDGKLGGRPQPDDVTLMTATVL